MQNLLLSSKLGNHKVCGRFFATIKNLTADLQPTDTLVTNLFDLVKSTYWTGCLVNRGYVERVRSLNNRRVGRKINS